MSAEGMTVTVLAHELITVLKKDGVSIDSLGSSTSDYLRDLAVYVGAEPAQPVEAVDNKVLDDLIAWHRRDGTTKGQKTVAALETLRSMKGNRLSEEVAYLDIGAGGYMDLGTDLDETQLSKLPFGRHILGIIGTHGVDGYTPDQPQPVGVPDGWKLVPVEPTDVMCINAREKIGIGANVAHHVWHWMLAAAPAPGKGGGA